MPTSCASFHRFCFPSPPLTTRQGHSFVPARKNRGPVASSVGGCAGADRGAGRRARMAHGRPRRQAGILIVTADQAAGKRLGSCSPAARRRRVRSNLAFQSPARWIRQRGRLLAFKASLEKDSNLLPTDYKSVALPNELSNGAAGWNRTTDLRTDRSGALPLSYNRVFRPPVRRRTQGWQCRLRGWSF